jgi:predicted dehydrogenase
MDSLGVGLIGFGYAGHTFHAPLIGATPGMHLAAVASSDPRKVRASLGDAMPVTTAQALVEREDVDLVVVATPNELHHPHALAALRAGCHVVIDKPFVLDVAQAEELVAAARRGRRLLSVFHNRRWDSDFLTLQRLLVEGRVGRPVELSSHFDRFRPQVRQRWRVGDGPGAGLWMDLGPHLLDQALVLFGWPAAIHVDRAAMRDGARADDWFHAQLRWADGPHAGLRVRLHASTLAAEPGNRFALHGTSGSVTVAGLDAQEERLKAGADAARIGADDWGRDERHATLWSSSGAAPVGTALPMLDGRYPSYYKAIVDAVRGVGEPPVSADDALAVQRLLDAGRISARERREVALDPVPSAPGDKGDRPARRV